MPNVLLRRLPLVPVLVLAACASMNRTPDFASNSIFYDDVPFKTKAPGDRAAFVTPVADARSTAGLPAHERGFPITYCGDEFWERPIVEMLGDVLTRQFEDSGLFTAVTDRAAPEALVVRPHLVSWTSGAIEAMSGSSSFAEVAIRIQVFGPAAASGERPLWHDRVYHQRQSSDVALTPVSPYRLVGGVLRSTVAKVLAGLDGSNVGRSHVPFDAGAESARPAEAATRR
jgi:hypothetical protein